MAIKTLNEVKSSHKKTNTTIKKPERPKDGPYSEDGRAEEMLYATEESLRKLLARWTNAVLEDETILHPMEYLVRKGIYTSTAKRWIAKYEFFKEGHESIKDIIGMRRERLMLNYYPSKHDYILPHYLGEYKEQRDSDKKDQTDTTQPITVILPDYSKLKED